MFLALLLMYCTFHFKSAKYYLEELYMGHKVFLEKDLKSHQLTMEDLDAKLKKARDDNQN